jgi:hypothetical protein
LAWVGPASKTSLAGQVGQVAPSAALLGSPLRANAPMVAIMAAESASRPGLLAVLLAALENSEGPKLPKMKGRSNAWAAP